MTRECSGPHADVKRRTQKLHIPLGRCPTDHTGVTVEGPDPIPDPDGFWADLSGWSFRPGGDNVRQSRRALFPRVPRAQPDIRLGCTRPDVEADPAAAFFVAC